LKITLVVVNLVLLMASTWKSQQFKDWIYFLKFELHAS